MTAQQFFLSLPWQASPQPHSWVVLLPRPFYFIISKVFKSVQTVLYSIILNLNMSWSKLAIGRFIRKLFTEQPRSCCCHIYCLLERGYWHILLWWYSADLLNFSVARQITKSMVLILAWLAWPTDDVTAEREIRGTSSAKRWDEVQTSCQWKHVCSIFNTEKIIGKLRTHQISYFSF